MNWCLWVTIQFYKFGIQIYRFFDPPVYEPVSANHISASCLPWLFVGIELKNGDILDKTEEAQSLVDKGFPITPTTISVGVDETLMKRCFYLDAKTLKEQEIPTEGITRHDS